MKVSTDCDTCPLEKYCPIPNDNINSATTETLKRLFARKLRKLDESAV